MRNTSLHRTVRCTATVLAALVVMCLAWFAVSNETGLQVLAAGTPVAVAGAKVKPGSNKTLMALAEKKTGLIASMKQLLDEAGTEDFTEEQEQQYSQMEEDLAAVEKKIKRTERLAGSQQQSTTRITMANDPEPEDDVDYTQVTHTKPAWEDDPMCGFKNHREYLMGVLEAPKKGEVTDRRLNFLAAAGSDEQSGQADPYGAFFLPEAMMPGVLTVGFDADPTTPTSVPMTTSSLKINARVDKDHSTSVSGGLTVGRNIETQAASSSRQKYEQVELSVSEQAGVAYATELVLSQSPVSFVALLDAGMQDEFAANGLREKIRGTGAGEPMGVLNSPCLVSIAKEGGQAADTINGTNLIKMRSRIWSMGWGRAIWMANPDTIPQLIGAHKALTNTDQPIFIFGNGTDVPDTLLGRPIFFNEFCSTLGDQGDIMLCDWSQYLWGTMGSDRPERAESVHVRFLEGERTFKFWLYNDGQPWWRSALTPNQGTTTYSPFVTLDERA